MEKFTKYMLGRLDDLSAWIGVIGLIFISIGFHGALTMLFVLLVIVPQTQFTSFFKDWTQKLRDFDK